MAPYTLYRLPDALFWAIVLAGVLFCLGYAARRAFRPPLPETTAGGTAGAQRHTRFRRFFHWGNFVSVAILLLSGLAMYRSPILPDPGGPPAFWFAWHQWVTPAFLVLVVAHILYESRAPDDIAPMWFGRGEGRKYSPAQILFHWAVAANLFALVLTGSVLWKPLRALLPLSLLGLGWDFIFFNRILHGFFTATLMALILAHIYFALGVRENWARTKSMVTGAGHRLVSGQES
jgi:cytochrome b subunit of formate dehydrogenase